MDIEIGGDTFTKRPNILEEIAYRDTWGKGADSFIAMIYERLVLMRDLLGEDGSIYLHCDWRVSGYIRLAMDEVFGKNNFVNEIIWKRTNTHNDPKRFGKIHDTIFFYAQDGAFFNAVYGEYDEDYIASAYRHVSPEGRQYRLLPLHATHVFSTKDDNTRRFGDKVLRPPSGKYWRWSQKKIDEAMKTGLIVLSSNDVPQYKKYLDEAKGVPAQSLWDDLKTLHRTEMIGYPTQKPEALLERIIQASSSEGDLVADFFCGSGTTAAVAEKLGRKWIVSDLGKFAVHTTRKRMIAVQRQLKAESKDYRAFEILNLGKYERQHYIGVNPNLRETEQQKQLAEKETAFVDLILRAYRAERTSGFATFHAYGHLDVAAVNSFSNDLPQAQVVQIKSLRHAQLEIEEAVVDAFHADAHRPAVLLGTRLRVAGHGETFDFFRWHHGRLAHKESDAAFCFPGAAWAGASMSSSANCKSWRRA